MHLDIATEKGQQSLSQERVLIASAQAAYQDIQFVETNKYAPSQIDGLMIRDGEVIGIYESKCRNMNIEQMHRFNDEWLVTFEKILNAADLSKRLYVPFYGLLYLVQEPIGLILKITDNRGNILPKARIEQTTTQKTINGGSIVRTNAYIDISTCHTFPIIL
jgi:hypothetical protein